MSYHMTKIDTILQNLCERRCPPIIGVLGIDHLQITLVLLGQIAPRSQDLIGSQYHANFVGALAFQFQLEDAVNNGHDLFIRYKLMLILFVLAITIRKAPV